MTTTDPTILVFDSGVGGLSILREIQSLVPQCRFHYACDNEAFPYGTKGEEELIARVDLVLKKLIELIEPDIVVIACNTASTVALPRIRSHFSRPVVGVVPAIKPAAAATGTGVIGLLGTPGTVERPYTQWLIDEFAPDATIIRVGSSRLVTIAEEKLRGVPPDVSELAEILAPVFADPRCDTLILACTHFPLLQEELEQSAPRKIQWLDSGNAIARRVSSFTGLPDEQAPVAPQPYTAWITVAAPDLENGLMANGACRVTVVVCS